MLRQDSCLLFYPLFHKRLLIIVEEKVTLCSYASAILLPPTICSKIGVLYHKAGTKVHNSLRSKPDDDLKPNNDLFRRRPVHCVIREVNKPTSAHTSCHLLTIHRQSIECFNEWRTITTDKIVFSLRPY